MLFLVTMMEIMKQTSTLVITCKTTDERKVNFKLTGGEYNHKGYDRLSFFDYHFLMIIEKCQCIIKKWWKTSCSFSIIIDFKSWTYSTFIIFNDDLFFCKEASDAIVWLCVVRKKWVLVESKVFNIARLTTKSKIAGKLKKSERRRNLLKYG